MALGVKLVTLELHQVPRRSYLVVGFGLHVLEPVICAVISIRLSQVDHAVLSRFWCHAAMIP